MERVGTESGGFDKRHAAVCGIFCGACALFIATREDPERLAMLAARLGLSEEAARCCGCRSDKRSGYCEQCRFVACAAGRGIDFCGECNAYPCGELETFQAERPHRIELWDDQERIRAVGCEQWLREMQDHYRCPRCRTLNSAYDLTCRKCGNGPSCEYVDRHGKAIEAFFAKR